MKLNKKWVLIVSLCAIIVFPISAKTVNLKFIETSDVHGAFFPYDFINAKDVPTSLSQVFTYVQQERSNKKQKVILMDNGDILQGQPTVYYYNFDKTEDEHICAQIMNYMKYDVGVVGNHDVEPGHEVYDKLTDEFDFPWLAANAVRNDSDEPYFEPYTIIKKKGVKIAILGLITPGVPNWLPEKVWEGMSFEDMVESAEKWVEIIQEDEEPDLLIGLFHSGVDYTYGKKTADTPKNENAARIVAQNVSGFDAVFVGHDHAGWNEVVKNPEGEDVLLLGSVNAAKTVAVASIEMEYNKTKKQWEKVSAEGEIIESKEFEPDEKFMKKFHPIVEELKAYVDKPIGTFTSSITTRDAMFGDSPFVDIIHKIQLEMTGADVSFAAPLSFNATIDKGEVFVRDAFNLYKYENLLYTMELSGKEIKDFLEYSYGSWFNQMKSKDDNMIRFKKSEDGNLKWSARYSSFETFARYYNYDSAAGIKYIVDISKPIGQRITISSMADGSSFDEDKIYKVAINSYRGGGGGGHLTKGAGIPKDKLEDRMLSSTIKDLRFFLKEWIKRQGTVDPVALGNWSIIPTDWWEEAKKRDYRLLYESDGPIDGPKMTQ